MSNMSNYLEEKILSAELSGSANYVALYSTSPGDDDTGTEISVAGYARKAVTFSAPVQSMGKATVENTATIEFPPIPVGYGSINYIGIRDAATAGNLKFHGPLAESVIGLADAGIRILPKDLVVSLD